MEIKARPATIADAPAIRALEKELIVYERTLEPSLKPDENLYYYDILSIIRDSENAILIVLEDDGAIIGCGFGEIRSNEHYYRQEKFGYIGLMSVTEQYRGQGLGGMIIQALLDFFKSKNIREVKLKVFSNNDPAIRAYEKMGFEGYFLEMKRSI